MNISELIKKLKEAKKDYGDLPLTNYGGFIRYVTLTAAKDGVVYPLEPGQQNEVHIDLTS